MDQRADQAVSTHQDKIARLRTRDAFPGSEAFDARRRPHGRRRHLTIALCRFTQYGRAGPPEEVRGAVVAQGTAHSGISAPQAWAGSTPQSACEGPPAAHAPTPPDRKSLG